MSRDEESATQVGILWVVLPFVCVGLVGGALTAVRLSLDVALAHSAFPSRGELVLTAHFFPQGGTVVTSQPGAVQGLKIPYLAVLAGLAMLESVVIALGTAVACWRLEHQEWRPPDRAVGWLVSYAVGTAVLSVALLLSVGVFAVPRIVLVALLLVLPVVLFLVPAVIVFEQADPLTACWRGLQLWGSQPVRTTLWALVLGYLGYLLTGVVLLFDTVHLGAYVTGTVCSTAIVGSAHALVLVHLYHSGGQERETQTPVDGGAPETE